MARSRGQTQVISRAEIDPSRGAPADGTATFMVGSGVLHARGVKAGFPRAKAEVDVFERKEIRLVQQTDSFEHLAPDEHHAAAHRIDQADRV